MIDFEKSYEAYARRVYAVIYAMCGDYQLSEELTQDTFCQAFTSFHRYNGSCEMFTWLVSIAKHLYFKHLRKEKRGYEAISLEAVTDAYFRGYVGNPEREVMRKNVQESVSRLVNKLPKKYHDVVILRIYAEMPFSEVARAMGITEGSAKVLFFRAKKMLLEEIKNELEL